MVLDEAEQLAYRDALNKAPNLRSAEDKLLIAKKMKQEEEDSKLAVTPFLIAVCQYYRSVAQAVLDAIMIEPYYIGSDAIELKYERGEFSYTLQEHQNSLPIDEEQTRRCIEFALVSMPNPPAEFPKRFSMTLHIRYGWVQSAGGYLPYFLDVQAANIAHAVMSRLSRESILIPIAKDSIYRLSLDYVTGNAECDILRTEIDDLDLKIAKMIVEEGAASANFANRSADRDAIPDGSQMCFLLDLGELRKFNVCTKIQELTTTASCDVSFSEKELAEQKLRRFQIHKDRNPGDVIAELDYLCQSIAFAESDEHVLNIIETARRLVAKTTDSYKAHEKLGGMLLGYSTKRDCLADYIDEISKEIKVVRDLHPSKEKVKNLTQTLVHCYERAGKFDEALQEMQHPSLDEDKHRWFYISDLAHIHEQMGDYESAHRIISESALPQSQKDSITKSLKGGSTNSKRMSYE